MIKALLRTILVIGIIVIVLVTGFAGTSLSPYRMAVVQTGSMSPTLPSKSLLLIQKGRYDQGQPVAFYHHGEIMTHRWVSTNSNGSIATKGDANTSVDPWDTPRSEVIGGVVYSIPELGFWLIYLQNPFGIGSLMLSALCLWLRPATRGIQYIRSA